MIRKVSSGHGWLENMFFTPHPLVELCEDKQGQPWAWSQDRALRSKRLSSAAWALLRDLQPGPGTVAELAQAASVELSDELLDELFELWSERLAVVSPTPVNSDLVWPSAFENKWV